MAPPAKGAAPAAKKAARGIWQLYTVTGDKLVRKNKFSPKAGEGYFMANHKDRRTCGKTGYMEKI